MWQLSINENLEIVLKLIAQSMQSLVNDNNTAAVENRSCICDESLSLPVMSLFHNYQGFQFKKVAYCLITLRHVIVLRDLVEMEVYIETIPTYTMNARVG